MPKLNVQQNNANVIKALRNALAIGQIKGPIASDGNDNFSTSGSNPNLLDNAYFVGGGSQLGDGVFPINQRGQSSYSGTGNTIDRWKCNDHAGVLSLSASGMSITVGTQFCGYQQYLPMGALVEGETYTLSIKINGTVYSWTIPSLSTSGQSQTAGWFGNNNIYSYIGVLNGNWRIMPFDSANGTTSTVSGIQAMKLEKGSVSTLANDPPPDFGEELRKCLRYLYILECPMYSYAGLTAFAFDATTMQIVVDTPVPMRRAIPTVSVANSFLDVAGNHVTAVSSNIYPYGNKVQIVGTGSGMVGSTLYAVTSNGAVITISCEL